MFKTLSAPLLVQWEVTDKCNKKCVYCYNYWRGKQGRKGTPLATSPKSYDGIVNELVTSNVFSVVITGGEPLLVMTRLLPYVQQLSRAGIDVSLNSNLSLLTDSLASTLNDCGIRSILTSLPSSDPSTDFHLTNRHNSLTSTSRGIEIAVNHGFRVTSNMVVSKKNLHQIFSTAQYVQQLGVNSFSATKVSKPVNSSDFSDFLLSLNEFRSMADEVLRVKTELGMKVESLEAYPVCSLDNVVARDIAGFSRLCSAGKTYCVVGADGNIRPCILVSKSYGRIQDSLKESWLAMDEWRTDKLVPHECQKCSFRTTCAGGCRADAQSINGSLTSLDPYCDLSRPPQPRTKKIEQSVTPASFHWNSKVKLRREDFGGIAYMSSSRWQAIGNRLYALISEEMDSGSPHISIETFANKIGVTVDDAKQTANLLLGKGIIISDSSDR